MNVLVPILFLRNDSRALRVTVVLWVGGGCLEGVLSSLSESSGGVHWDKEGATTKVLKSTALLVRKWQLGVGKEV